MAVFNISGSCTLRDAFGFKENCEHSVKHFLQFTSPITWFDFLSEPDKKLTFDDLNNIAVERVMNKSNFSKRCVIIDYNRTALDYFVEKSDYFIIDFAELVMYGLVELTKQDGSKHYFTKTNQVSMKNENNICFLDMLKGDKKIIPPSSYLNNKSIDMLVNNLYDYLINKQGYLCKQIILVRTVHALDIYDDRTKTMTKFSNYKELLKQNSQLQYIYDTFEKRFNNCYSIYFPENLYAYLPHRWGKHSLHFSKEIYDYLYNSFDLISKNQENAIKSLYTNLCTKLYNDKTQICKYPSLEVKTYYANTGWKLTQTNNYIDNSICEQIEAFKISIINNKYNGSVFYAAKVGNRASWTNTYSDGHFVGTINQKMRIHALKAWLDEKTSQLYTIKYKALTNDNHWLYGNDGSTIEIDDNEYFVNIFFSLEKIV